MRKDVSINAPVTPEAESAIADIAQRYRLTREAGVSQPVVSRHLRQLKDAGLVTGEVAGRETRYRAEPGALGPLVDWTVEMTAFWDGKLDRLADLLNRMDQ